MQNRRKKIKLYSIEKKKAIGMDYKNGATLIQIRQRHKITDYLMYRVLDELGIPKRGQTKGVKPEQIPATPPAEEIVELAPSLFQELREKFSPDETNPAQDETIRQLNEVLQRADETNPEKDDTEVTPAVETADKVNQNVNENQPIDFVRLRPPTIEDHLAIRSLLGFMPVPGTEISGSTMGALQQFFEATCLLIYKIVPNNNSAKPIEFPSHGPEMKKARK